MQTRQLFGAYRTFALGGSLKKICLNLLKGSQNSFSALQPEFGPGHGVGFQHGEMGEEKSLFLCHLSALFALPTR